MEDAVPFLYVVVDFMKNVHGNFNLNPSNFVTLVSFSCDCALKTYKSELERRKKYKKKKKKKKRKCIHWISRL